MSGLWQDEERGYTRTANDLALQTFTKAQKAFIVAFVIASLLGLLAAYIQGQREGLQLVVIGYLLLANGATIAFYFAVVLFRSVVTAYALGTESSSITIRGEDIRLLRRDALPLYTILVPLYKESRVLPRLIDKLSKIDYPAERLQILLLLEDDDKETIEAAEALDLPPCFELVYIPAMEPRTKPKACNVGLRRAHGEFCVIYDAEDQPDPDQLLKVVTAFTRVQGKGVACIQAKLEYWNPNTNILTRFFAAEYTHLFNLVLPGLSKLGLPIALGGTSNHFPTQVLKEIGGWDPYNVTEDCDLGIWIARLGMKTETLNAITLEEANSKLGNWIRQRSRWIKGYMQTYLVHMRSPWRLYKDLGPRNFLAFQLLIGGTPLCLLVNPFFWTLTALYVVTSSGFVQNSGTALAIIPDYIRMLFPGWIFYLGLACMVFGNFIFVHQLLTACILRERYSSILLMLFAPIYWGLMSIAAWKAIIQLIFKPHYWEKTTHGIVEEDLSAIDRMLSEALSKSK